MMAPRPRSRMASAAAWERTMTARHRTSSARSSSARSPCRKLRERPKPALLTSRSTGRPGSARRSATFCTWSRSDRSAARISQCTWYFASSSSETFSRRARSRATSTRSWPRSASSRQKARPMPAVAPVTSAVAMTGSLGPPPKVDHVRIATWNVNSIRSQIDRVEAWLQRSDCDVLAIQETKATDEQFPFERLRSLGYEVAHHGLNHWNGVAILSRVGLENPLPGFDSDPGWGEPLVQEARSLSATCNGVRIVSVYVPNGRHIDDPHMAY